MRQSLLRANRVRQSLLRDPASLSDLRASAFRFIKPSDLPTFRPSSSRVFLISRGAPSIRTNRVRRSLLRANRVRRSLLRDTTRCPPYS
jgi:hypothetical protein